MGLQQTSLGGAAGGAARGDEAISKNSSERLEIASALLFTNPRTRPRNTFTEDPIYPQPKK